jgi:hypothetical protein
MRAHNFSVECTIILQSYHRINFVHCIAVGIKLHFLNRKVWFYSFSLPVFHDGINNLRHVEYKTGIICEYVRCLKTLSNFKFTQGLDESKKYEYGALTD